MATKHLVSIIVFCFFLCSCKETKLRHYSFYNTKYDICIDLEMDKNYLLKDTIPRFYEIKIFFQNNKGVGLQIKYPISFNKKMLSDTSFSFDDKIFIQNYCKGIKENMTMDTVFQCDYSKKYNQNYLTYAYSEKPKYRGYDKTFKSLTVDFDDAKIFMIETVSTNKKLDWDTIKKMHFDVLDKLVITKNCKTK